jgi:outer membrane protein OmpA-like peptidoglycan-associated protein
MLRTRTLLPLLISSLAFPAAAGEYGTCLTAADSLSCIIEQVEFARQRNAEIDASMETVASVRAFERARNAEIDASMAIVASVRAFARARNAEIDASMATVARARAFQQARNAEIDASIAAVNTVRTHELEIAQNILADAALGAANGERNRRFAAHQNALASASMAAVETARARRLALSFTQCKSRFSHTPRCETERAQKFARLQNTLATASMQRVKAERDRQFAAARNIEINASLAAVRRDRAAQSITALNTSHCAGTDVTPRCEGERNHQLALSLTHCKSADDTSPRCVVERDREFHIARNAEIDHAIAAYEGARALARTEAAIANGRNVAISAAMSAYGNINAPLETGTLGIPVMPTTPEYRAAPARRLQHNIATDPCRAAGTPFAPLSFTKDADIDEAMKPELDRLAGIALTCPGVRIEIHGHSDGTGSLFTNRRMAQASAQAVADYLIAAGVAANRVAAIGRGSMESALPYSEITGRANRRSVEFIIKDPAIDAAARRVMWDLAELLDPTYVPAVAGLSP